MKRRIVNITVGVYSNSDEEAKKKAINAIKSDDFDGVNTVFFGAEIEN